jgi:hypothetical protein
VACGTKKLIFFEKIKKFFGELEKNLITYIGDIHEK